jgi:hypothetical protein
LSFFHHSLSRFPMMGSLDVVPSAGFVSALGVASLAMRMDVLRALAGGVEKVLKVEFLHLLERKGGPFPAEHLELLPGHKLSTH